MKQLEGLFQALSDAIRNAGESCLDAIARALKKPEPPAQPVVQLAPGTVWTFCNSCNGNGCAQCQSEGGWEWEILPGYVPRFRGDYDTEFEMERPSKS